MNELTPDERARIYQEEKARIDALGSKPGMSGPRALVYAALVLFVVVMGLGVIMQITSGDEMDLAQRRAATAETVEIRRQIAAASQSWQHIAGWSGSGTKTTELFSVSGEWRVTWKTGGPGAFIIFVHDASGNQVAGAANTATAGSDTSYVHTGPGRFYLDIISVVNWTITVEDQR